MQQGQISLARDRRVPMFVVPGLTPSVYGQSKELDSGTSPTTACCTTARGLCGAQVQISIAMAAVWPSGSDTHWLK